MPVSHRQKARPPQLSSPPDETVRQARCGAVIAALRTAMKITFNQMADALSDSWANSGESDGQPETVDVETIKRWRANVVPGRYQRIVEVFIRAHAQSPEIANAWWELLTAAWAREEREKETLREDARLTRARRDKLIASLKAIVLADRQLTRLPALFETEMTLPLASAYVELRLAPSSPVVPMRQILEHRATLAERIKRRTEQRLLTRRPPQQALDQADLRCRLIVGAPGTGKSSLLRRLALDIAGGAWATAAVPLFVDARAFAQARRIQPGLTIVDFACRRAASADVDAASIRQLLISRNGSEAAVLLVDGLDEIASDAEAVAAVYGELGDGASDMAWIVTARPAGLMQALNEDKRYEMAELDPDAVSALVENWCAANAQAGLTLDARALRIELERVPGMREMATNPFLLTALCFLKSTARDEALPNSRIAVYETLLERIAHQAQSRHNSRAILSATALAHLAEFACHLYRRPEGAVQIFTATAWQDFVASNASVTTTDFDRQIVPGRLLTVWSEADPQYHFLHLTLHEHMVARAMLDWPVTDALRFRFYPAWQAVFRFYGALLWQRGRGQPFAELTAALFQSRDVNGLSLITLAEIFADAGLRDTTRQLGADLREVLLQILSTTTDTPVGTEAFVDALALLDPDWLAERTARDEDRMVKVGRESAGLLDLEEHYPGEHQIQYGQTFNGPYRRLARTYNATALAKIEATFWGDDQDRALMTAAAFAEIATPEQRDRVVEVGMQAIMFDAAATRVYAFCVYSRANVFLPFLRRVIEHCARNGADPFSEALSIVADIGGAQAAEILNERLRYELGRQKNKAHQIEICARALARLGGPAAMAGFDKAIEMSTSKTWRTYLTITRDSIAADHEAQMIGHLKNFDTGGTALRALADVASFGRLPSDKVMTAVQKLAMQEMMCDGFDLAILERQRIDAGEAPRVCRPLLAAATALLPQLREARRNSPEEWGMTSQLPVILDTLGRARWMPARALLETIMADRKLPDRVVEAAIEASGFMLERSGDTDMLDRLGAILFDDRAEVDAYDVTLAIGRIDLERLFQLRGARTATSTLQQISAERDEPIFETEWVDRTGTVTRWTAPPAKVLYGASPKHTKLVELVSHELSRFSLHLVHDWPADCCAALIVFEPLKPQERTFSEVDVRMIEDEGGKVYRLSTTSISATRRRARAIGEEIARTLQGRLPAVRRPD